MNKLFRALGSAVLLAAICWKVDWSQVAGAMGRLNWLVWSAAFGVYLVAQVLSSYRWQLLAKALGFSGRLASYVRDVYLGMFFNLILPTSVGGDVVRAISLARRRGQTPPMGQRLGAALSVLADRVVGVLVLVGTCGIATVICPISLPGWIPWCVAGLGAGGIAGLVGLPLIRRLLATERFQGFRWEKPRRMVEGALFFLGRPRLLVATASLSAIVQIANVLVVYLIGRNLGLPVPATYYGIMVPLVALLTMLPVSLNGMGLREGGMVLMLAPLGVGTAEALSLSLLSFLILTTASMCGGLCLLFGGDSGSRVEAEDEAGLEQTLAKAG